MALRPLLSESLLFTGCLPSEPAGEWSNPHTSAGGRPHGKFREFDCLFLTDHVDKTVRLLRKPKFSRIERCLLSALYLVN